MFEITGQLKYYNRYVIIIIDDDIGAYYRKICSLHNRMWNIQSQSHGTHVTVVPGKYESASNSPKWKKYDGEHIKLEYSVDIGTDGCYFWLPVVCKKIETIRVELGLNPTIPIPWHMTIGNIKRFQVSLTPS